MARHDESHGCVAQRVEHRQVALAGDAECEIGAVQDELVDEDLPAAPAHGRTTGCSKYTVGRWVFGFSASAGST